MITYTGNRRDGYVTITVGSDEGTNYYLPPRLDLFNHSPSGFEWGYRGSGPAQTALAILAHATGDDAFSLHWHRKYMADLVADFPEEFSLTIGSVMSWVKRHQ